MNYIGHASVFFNIFLSVQLSAVCYCNSDRAVCGIAFACTSTAVAACVKICARVNSDTSSATSASRIDDSDAWMFWIAF